MDESKENIKEDIKEYGHCRLDNIELLTIIGEIEGHECLGSNSKTTKYEHVLPMMAEMEAKKETEGLLILVNTVGGDVSCGLALAEMIASLSIKTVSLIIGDSHSIGLPIAVASDYSFIVPTATIIIHPVRMNGMVLGTKQTFEQFRMMQERILSFVAEHSKANIHNLTEMMMNTTMMSKDLGTVLVGEDAVKQGVIDEVGGVAEAFKKVKELTCKDKANNDIINQ